MYGFSVHCRKLQPIFNDLAVWYETKGLHEREIVFVRIDVSDGNKPIDLNVSGYSRVSNNSLYHIVVQLGKNSEKNKRLN